MNLLIFGFGYTGRAILDVARAAGHDALITSRTETGPHTVAFASASDLLPRMDAIVMTAAPDDGGDPILAAHGPAIAAAPLRYIGYLSTTGVYGDRDGGWVDETTAPRPAPGRSTRRLAAEHAWRDAAAGRPLDLLRVAGIYGPGRSVLDDVRAGQARIIDKPGHAFGRIHRDDIAGAVLAALAHPPEGTRVLNLSDDLPAPNAEVVAFACALLGVQPPAKIPFADAAAGMSPMGLSFWAENRRVRAAATQAALARPWLYPTFREGLRAILREDAGEQGEI